MRPKYRKGHTRQTYTNKQFNTKHTNIQINKLGTKDGYEKYINAKGMLLMTWIGYKMVVIKQ